MTVNGKRSGITEADFYVCAAHMNLTKAKAAHIIGDVTKAVNDWQKFAEISGVPEKEAEAIARQISKR